MTNLDRANTAISIAAVGHVYVGDVGAKDPDLFAYQFGDGTTLEADGWTWLGDTSSENPPSIAADGGDSKVKRSWDRQAVSSTSEPKTYTLTIHAITMTHDVIDVAFNGSAHDTTNMFYDLNLDGVTERSVLVVIVDGRYVSGFRYKRVKLSGALPTLSVEDFTDTTITGPLLAPPSGTALVRFYERRMVTGKSTAAPTVTSHAPEHPAAGTVVVLTGTHFTGTRHVLVDGESATFEVRSDTALGVRVPAGTTAAEHNFRVINGAGEVTHKITTA